MSIILVILLFLFLFRLYKCFEDHSIRHKLKRGTLERDFQKLCLELSRYGELKEDITECTLIKDEMFECLIENTKYLVSNENLWKKLEEKKSELTCKYLVFLEFNLKQFNYLARVGKFFSIKTVCVCVL